MILFNNTDRGGCMLSFDSIKLEDKIYFDKILKKKEYEACEYCFTNFYIWKESFDLECSIDNIMRTFKILIVLFEQLIFVIL